MDPKRHPNRKGLEQLSKKFKFDYFSTFPGLKRFIDGEIEKYLDKNLDCDDLWDEDGLSFPEVDVYEIHEDKWFDKLRKADRKFGDLCDFWIQTYMDGIEDSRKNREEAEDWLYEAVIEGFWAEFPDSYVEEEFEDYFEEARQSCMEEEDERRDPYGARGLSRRDFMASSQRNSLIRLAASLPAGDKSRRAILAGLRTRTASS